MSKEAMKLALEALEMYLNMGTMDESYLLEIDLAPKAITALRKALAEQPEQQAPFAFYFETYSYEGQCSTWFVKTPCDGKLNGKPGLPLYTSPPAQQEPVATLFGSLPVYDTSSPAQRTWVGLRHEEIDYQAKKDDHAVYFALGALWAEAKLKEKNT